MAEKHQQMTELRRHPLTGKTILLASLAGAIIGGPLVGLMGFTFLATTTLLLVTSPLFILFSPLLFGAAFTLTLAMAGFAAAGAMAVVGVMMVARVARSLITGGGAGDKFIESGEAMKEDLGGHLQQKAGHIPHEIINVMRG